LLDDFDDLEKNSDKSVEEHNYIGKYYKVHYAEEEGTFIMNFSLNELKKCKFKYHCDDCKFYRSQYRTKLTISARAICNMVLNSRLSLLDKNSKEYTNAETELIKKLYSCSHLVDDKGFLEINVHKFHINDGGWFVKIDNNQDQSSFIIKLNRI
jgi:hypothetical protein